MAWTPEQQAAAKRLTAYGQASRGSATSGDVWAAYGGNPGFGGGASKGSGAGSTPAAKKSFNLGTWALDALSFTGSGLRHAANTAAGAVAAADGRDTAGARQYKRLMERISDKRDNGEGLLGAVVSSQFEDGAEAFGANFSKNKTNDQKDDLSYSESLNSLGVTNPWVKGIGGFAADVALDPTTYLSLGTSAAVKGLVKGGAAAAKASKGGKVVDIAAETVERGKWGQANPFIKNTKQSYTAVTDATKSGNMFSNIATGAAKGAAKSWNADLDARYAAGIARKEARTARKSVVAGSGELAAAAAPKAYQKADAGAKDALEREQADLLDAAPEQVPSEHVQETALDVAAKQVDEAAVPKAPEPTPDSSEAEGLLDASDAEDAAEAASRTAGGVAAGDESFRTAQKETVGNMFATVHELPDASTISNLVRDGVSRSLVTNKKAAASATSGALAKMQPFQEHTLLDSLDSGANGWRGLTKTWKNVKSGTPLTRVQKPFEGQVSALAKQRIKADKFDRGTLGALREVGFTDKTHVTGGELMDLVEKGADKRWVQAKGHRPAAVAQARQLLSAMVKRQTARTVAGTRGEQLTRWQKTVASALGGTERAKALAAKLAEISDPDEFSTAINDFAKQTTESGFRSWADFMKYIDKTDDKAAAAALGTDSREGIRSILGALGIKTPHNEGVASMVRKLKAHGKVKYDETVRAYEANKKLLNEQGVPGAQQIETLANDFDVDAARAGAKEEAERLIADFDEFDYDSFTRTMAATLDYSIGGWKALGKGREFTNKSGVLTRSSQDLEKGIKGRTLIHSWNQNSSMAFFKGSMRSAALAADKAGIANPRARAAFMDDYVMRHLAMQDSFLRVNGVVPTVTAPRKLKIIRGLDANKHEYAFLSLHDVLAALPDNIRQAAVFMGKDNNTYPTTIAQAAMMAMKRPETTKSIEDYATAMRTMYLAEEKALGNKFQGEKNYQAVVDQIVRALNTPETVDLLTKTHLANGTFARAAMGQIADEITGEARKTFEDLLDSGASLGTKIGAIDKNEANLLKLVTEAGLADSQVPELTRLQNTVALARALDPDDFNTVRTALKSRAAGSVMADGSAASEKAMAAAAAKVDEIMRRRVVTVSDNIRGVVARRMPESSRQAAERSNQIKVTRDVHDTMTDVMDSEAWVSKAMAHVPDEFSDAFTAADVRIAMQIEATRNGKTIGALQRAMSASAEAQDVDPMRVLGSFSWRKQTEEFDKGLAAVAKRHGDDTLNAAFRFIQQVPDEIMDATFGNFRNGKISMDEALAGFRDAIAKNGVNPATVGGDDFFQAVRDIAGPQSLVFGGSQHNLLSRVGIDPKYLNGFLKRTGMADEGVGGFVFPEGANAADLHGAWRHAVIGGADGSGMSAVDFLRKTHAALQQAAEVPAVAANFSANFNHAAMGMSVSEARALGWKRVNFKDAEFNSILRFVDPDAGLYDPDMIRQLTKTGQMMSKINDPDSAGILEKVLKRADPVVNAVKTSITIWRPGHWLANILGEYWANIMAGVANPISYKKSLDVLFLAGRVGKHDPAAFDQYVAALPENFKPRYDINEPNVKVSIGGKSYPVTYDTIRHMAEQRGVILNHHQAEDMFLTADSQYKKRFGIISDATQQLAKGSAARDSIFRLTHFIDLLEKGNGRSIEEMADRAAVQVHKFHPSMQTLSGFEQGTMRRLVYFYTWQKQFLTRMVQGLLDNPGRVMIPQRLLYNLAQANGQDPDSPGNPVDRNTPLPSYLENSLTGTQFYAGYNPLQAGSMAWGFQLSNPGTDLLANWAGSLNYDSDKSLGENAVTDATGFVKTNGLGMVSPALAVPTNLINQEDSFGRDLGGDPMKNLQYLVDQTGLQYPSRISGTLGPLGARPDAKNGPDAVPGEQEGIQMRNLLNYLSGLKFNNFQSSAYSKVAESEAGQDARAKRMQDLLNQGYSKEDATLLTGR